jgi:hypothetical protein
MSSTTAGHLWFALPGNALPGRVRDCREAAARLKRDHPKAKALIHFFELFAESEQLTFDQIRQHAGKYGEDDEAVLSLVKRAREVVTQYEMVCVFIVSRVTRTVTRVSGPD